MDEEKKAAIHKYAKECCADILISESDEDVKEACQKAVQLICDAYIKGYEFGKREAEEIGKKEQI